MADGFDRWVAAVFGGEGRDEPEPSSRGTVRYLTRLFQEPEVLIGRYSADQIGDGLWFLVSPSGSNHAFALRDDAVPWEARRTCLEAIGTLYERLFARICEPRLGHLEKAAVLEGERDLLHVLGRLPSGRVGQMKPLRMTPLEAADLIERFVRGERLDCDWDGFLCCTWADPAVEAAKQECILISERFRDSHYYCTREGLERFAAIARELREHASRTG